METETTDDLIMAGFIGSPIWAVVDHTTSSALHSDAEDDDDDDDDDDQGEALSFCDLAIYADNSNGSSSSQQYQSNQHSSGGGEPQDHDFEFAPCGSQVRSAEDLFYKGRLLPLLPRRAAEMEHPALDCDLAAFRKSYSCKENRSAAALPAKVRTWRMNSLDSHTSRGFGFSRSSSRASGAASAPAPARTRKPAPKVGAAARAPPKPAKSSSLKWQFFTLGLMKTPPMRLDDIRLRQGRPSNADRSSSSSCVSEFSVSGSVLRRTVSCSSQDDVVTPATAPSLAAGKVKSKSVKENILCPAEPETARTSSSSSSSSSSKAWRMLKPLTALNGCRASSTSVVNCSSSSTARKQAPRSHDGFTNQNNNNAKLVSLSRLSEPHQQHRHDRPPLFCKISA